MRATEGCHHLYDFPSCKPIYIFFYPSHILMGKYLEVFFISTFMLTAKIGGTTFTPCLIVNKLQPLFSVSKIFLLKGHFPLSPYIYFSFSLPWYSLESSLCPCVVNSFSIFVLFSCFSHFHVN